jgi:hypothetical protein
MNILKTKAFGGLLFLLLAMAALLHSSVDARLSAGVDVPRRIFRIVSRDHPLPYEKGPEAFRSTDEWGPDC